LSKNFQRQCINILAGDAPVPVKFGQ